MLGYTPPSERRLRIALLDDCYTDMKNEVTKVFQASRHLRIVADESTNITNHRIQNVSVMCNQISYHWSSDNLEDEEATADVSVATIKAKALVHLKGFFALAKGFDRSMLLQQLLVTK